jgi:hypothetical protein
MSGDADGGGYVSGRGPGVLAAGCLLLCVLAGGLLAGFAGYALLKWGLPWWPWTLGGLL